jgi:excisionase family DNA binding protein
MRDAVRGRMPRSLFVKDAAALLGVSRRTVYYRIRDGRLRTIRTIGGSQRVLLESIEALLREEQARRETAPSVRGRDAAASDTAPSARSPGL